MQDVCPDRRLIGGCWVVSWVNDAELMSKSQTSVEVMPTPSPPVISICDVPKAQHENLERKLGAGDRSAIGVN